MWWFVGFGGLFLYLLVLFTLGFSTLRKGHSWLFVLGCFFPFLWLIGAFMSPTNQEYAQAS